MDSENYDESSDSEFDDAGDAETHPPSQPPSQPQPQRQPFGLALPTPATALQAAQSGFSLALPGSSSLLALPKTTVWSNPLLQPASATNLIKISSDYIAKPSAAQPTTATVITSSAADLHQPKTWEEAYDLLASSDSELSSDSESNANNHLMKRRVKFSSLFAPRLRVVKRQAAKRVFKKGTFGDADYGGQWFDAMRVGETVGAIASELEKPGIKNALDTTFGQTASQRQGYVLSRNDVDVFLGRIPQLGSKESWGVYRGRRWKEDLEEREIFENKVLPPSLNPIMLDSWEDKILWDDDTPDDQDVSKESVKKAREEQASLLIRNTALDAEMWTDAIIWDDEEAFIPPPLIIHDPTIVNDLKDWAIDDATNAPQTVVRRVTPAIDKFNLSNDRYYVMSGDHVRQTQGQDVLKHARAALEMLWPHYKTQLNTQELRSFHRPPIAFASGEEARFSRCKGYKKKKDVDPSKDYMNLSLKDSANYVLLEYSEEYPPILSNFGMATLLRNFYRKENEKDLTIPKLPIGIHTPLEKIDESPFNNFGDVKPGEVIQGIVNNLIRAPIWQHDVPMTDFLFVRHSYNGKVKYYLKDIPLLFVVGQTYPQQEVPRPQSRKVLNLMKARLHSIAYRLMLNNPNQRLWYDNLKKYFVGQPELLVRQRLREVAQNWKKGENTGWYKVKQNRTLPTEEELQKIITPEWCCLLETAFAGEQRLKDIGYANLDLGAGGEDGEDGEGEGPGGGGGSSSTDLEIQMAPWISTKNFVMTITKKGMVQLYGGGDPTGCGEGFSFIRQSMKEMFYREGEAPPKDAPVTPKNLIRFSYAEQQVVYKEEIRRIWNAQVKSLSSKAAVALPTEEELGEDDDVDEGTQEKLPREKSAAGETNAMQEDPSQSAPGSSSQVRDDDAMSVASTSAKKKRLLIQRKYIGPNGEEIYKKEIISDSRVMTAYLRQKLMQATQREAPPPEVEEEGKKRKKKPLDTSIIIGSDAPQQPQAGGSSSGQGLKLKFSLSSMSEVKPKPTDPEGALNRIFDDLVRECMKVPVAEVFCYPVDDNLFPDYRQIVRTPLCLADIRDKCRAKMYRTADAFMNDMILIQENSGMFNGPQNPITQIAARLVSRAQKAIQQLSHEIVRYENEIAAKSQTVHQSQSQLAAEIEESLMDLLG
ncbi:hypothetical protein BC830DRAFT_1162776 [Chytriomyces sp. MP71]|nr:hypothetical protein BC830DRAFT_1162776 [Chytriomyces sp. MP71]